MSEGCSCIYGWNIPVMRKVFYQLYTLHVYKNGHYLPCVFFLIPGKMKLEWLDIFVYITLTVVRLSWNISTSLIFVLNSQTLHMNNIELKPLLTIRTKVFCCLMHSNFKVKVEVKDIQSY
jgi:hypothetical protein